MSKPELGKIEVGDRLLVIPARMSRFADTTPRRVTVIKAARVWVDLVAEEDQDRLHPRTWRMRRDTQDEGTSSNYNDRFVTQEQYGWEQRARAAEEYLTEIDLQLSWQSPWTKGDKVIVLANLLRKHHGLDEL
jgi:hypothetical protein